MKSSNTKVVFLINWHLRIGGVERKIADISKYISDNIELKDKIVYLILDEKRPVDPNQGFFYDTVQESLIRILSKPQRRIWRFDFPFSLFILWKVFILRPVTILAFLRRVSVISVILKFMFWWRNTKVIISDDTVTSLSLKGEVKNRFRQFLVFHLIRKCYSRANAIVSPSENSKRDLINNFDIAPHKIVVNSNWVIKNSHHNSRRDQFDLIYVGRVDPEKNLALFAEIVHEVSKNIPTVRACIVGSGDEFERIYRLAKQYSLDSRLSFVGIQKDVDKYFLASKIFCLTSLYEGLPVAALEAMAHGLPVITTAYSGAEELVQDGKTGCICGDKQKYVASIIRLLQNEKQRIAMGEQARKYVRTHHGEENIKRFAELIIV